MKRLLSLVFTALFVFSFTGYSESATEIKFTNDETGAIEKVQGSDGRLNVSARADSRSFYISRDDSQAYVLDVEDDDAVAGDLVGYLKNDSTTKLLYISNIEYSCENACTVKVAFGDSTTATGTTVTPVNLNQATPKSADATALGNGAVGGVTASTFIQTSRTVANSDGMIEFIDALILGQNDNIVIEYDTGTTGDMEVSVHFFLE